VSLKDEKCGDRKRKTPNRRAERIASLPVTRNRRRAAFSSQVLQRFPRNKAVQLCLRFNQPPTQHVTGRALEALERIGAGSPLNAARVRRFGITVPTKTP